MNIKFPLLRTLPAAALFLLQGAQANNIQVANTTLTNNTGTTALVQFDISWENSWRGGGVVNWDAAWVFVKFKQSNGAWRHAYPSASGHTAPSGSLLDLGLLAPGTAHHATNNPVVGLFLRRSADGSGTFTANGVQLLWDFAAQGVIATNDIVEVKVFAVEMVYVNEGAFWVGDGISDNRFRAGLGSGPYQVESEGSITMSSFFGLWADGNIESGTLPAAFPKGYQAFYCMKYELSQQQCVDHLNTLSRAQQVSLVETNVGLSTITERYVMTGTATMQYRNGIRCDANTPLGAPVNFYCDANGNGIGGEYNDGQSVVANCRNPADMAAYMDWSGLRLMTELEYEKACRGPLTPIPDENAWGNAQSITQNLYVLANAFTPEEGVVAGYSTSTGNVSIPIGASPGTVFRVGIFAANPVSTGRMTSGAGYYGAMELTGNVEEITVGIHNAAGQGYTGAHGNGELSISGNHNVANWPMNDMASGFFIRSNGTYADEHVVSDRGPTDRGRYYRGGGRGVRTAP